MARPRSTLSASPDDWRNDPKAKRIAEIWNGLQFEELDAALWEVLDPIQRQVADCLSRRPVRLSEAESLTAQAMLMLAGRKKR